MKILYIILFFLDFSLMIFLSFLLLRLLDSNHRAWPVMMDAAGIAISIGILFFIMTYFSRLPLRHDQ